MKDEEITPKKYIQNVEEELYTFLEKNNYKKLPFPQYIEDEKQNENKLKRYYKTIISILYKQLCCNNEYDEKYNGIIRYTIEEIEKNINNNNLTQAYILFTSYSNYILDEMKKYFTRTNQNYILRKMPLQKLKEKRQMLRIQQINPFMLQECFEYYCNPLTPEEQIIGEILELKSSLNNINPSSVVKNLLIQMIKKYGYEEFKTILIFIICNVYQNAIEVRNERMINSTKYCIENLQVSNQDIINWFIPRNGEYIEIKKELLDIIQTFLYYNERIKEGDLRKLEKQPSYQYVKERLKKPNYDMNPVSWT